MTDKEIIKALECCSKSGWLNDCDGCSCYDEKEDIQTSECQERIMKNALDLINRQQEKIEYMQGERETLLEDIKASSNQVIEQQAEIEKLTINMNAFGLGMKREKERVDTIRTKAIKEFAEIYTENFIIILNLNYEEIEVARKVKDYLVKIMVGD